MFVLIVGAGRVGSAVAKSALAAGHEVSVLDEDPLSHERLDAGQGRSWEDAEGQFTVGTALETDALIGAGIERADVFIASTDGDNTNLIIAQIAQKRFGVEQGDRAGDGPGARQLVRRAGPGHDLPDQARDRDVRARPRNQSTPEAPAAVYAIIVGAGKVGRNLARELIVKGHEVTLIESSRPCYLAIEEEFEHAAQYGDATELWVLERAGIQRADLVIAVTGDDEDNMLVCQVAKEKYLCDRIIARVNNPRNHDHFRLLGIQPAVSATDLILRLIEHEVPRYGLVHLLALEEERLEIIELEVSSDAPVVGERVADIALPEGSLIISVLRDGAGFVPKPDTVIADGDEVLLVLDPGLEESITAFFAPNGSPVQGVGRLRGEPGRLRLAHGDGAGRILRWALQMRGTFVVAPGPSIGLAVAVRAKDLQVLQPVVVAFAVDMMQSEGNR